METSPSLRPLQSLQANVTTAERTTKRAKLEGESNSCCDKSEVEIGAREESVEPIPYPLDVPTAGPALVKKVVDLVLAKYSNPGIEGRESLEHCDQVELLDAGLLSLQHVLLPVVAYAEEQALRKVQSKIQRDDKTSPYVLPRKHCLVTTRKAVFDATNAACRAVAWSRNQREMKLEADRVARPAKIAAARQLAKSSKQKKSATNQELWRELAVLTSELAQLEEKELQWQVVKDRLAQQENEQTPEPLQLPPDASMQAQSNIDEVFKISQAVSQTAAGIALDATRIRQTLSHVADYPDKVRADLYQKYVRDHQWHGYRGANDAQSLLQALSQSQDDAW